jgi:hypothetical protein
MVATCAPSRHWPDGDPARRAAGARPTLVLVEGGRSAARRRHDHAVYLRRRLVVLALGALAVVAMAVGLDRSGLLGTGQAPAAGDDTVELDAAPVGEAVHIVQPGDTLWTIARDLAPGADPRPVVDALVAANGSGPLEVGDRIALPG